MAEPKQQTKPELPTRYVAIAHRTDSEGIAWGGYWWKGCHWPAGLHAVSVVADGHPDLKKEREAYAAIEPTALYSKKEAEERGEPELEGKFRPWRFMTEAELDSIITEPKHCIRVVTTTDARTLHFPPEVTGPAPTPLDIARERLKNAQGALAALGSKG